MSAPVLLLLVEEGPRRELPADPKILGLIAFGVLVTLLVVALQFNRDR